jgi:hypothetical protein
MSTTTTNSQSPQQFVAGVRERVAKIVVGQDVVVERVMIALLTGGHLLLPKGRELKDSDINRIIAINRVTPLTPFVLVYC